jgi:hypothetical protein
VEIEVLMNMELAIESTEVEVSQVNRTGKERQVVKFLMKRRILMETVPFKKKSKRIRKSFGRTWCHQENPWICQS